MRQLWLVRNAPRPLCTLLQEVKALEAQLEAQQDIAAQLSTELEVKVAALGKARLAGRMLGQDSTTEGNKTPRPCSMLAHGLRRCSCGSAPALTVQS